MHNMNKEYVYSNGQALIIDENNNQKVEPYYDELEKVLVQENVIEELEKRKEEVEKSLSKIRKIKKYSKKRVLLNTILFTFLVGVLPSMIISKLFDLGVTQVGPISAESFVIIMLVPVAFVSGLGAFLYDYLSYKDALKTKKGKETELELLNNKLKHEKETLEELKKNKTNSRNDNSFYASKIDDSKHLNSIDDWLYLYYSLGYDEDKFLKYYQKGILKEKLLAKEYNENQVNFVKDYFEENGPKLVKKM